MNYRTNEARDIVEQHVAQGDWLVTLASHAQMARDMLISDVHSEADVDRALRLIRDQLLYADDEFNIVRRHNR